MRAIRLAGTTPSPGEIPQPRPGQGEVLIRVFAAGVTPTEVIWYPTSHTKDGGARSGAVPSHEFSGTIAETGEGVEALAPGQEVFGMNDWFAEGALADYCVTRPDWIAPKPERLNHAEAASVPIGALTAWQGLFERAKLQSGEHLLVHGGAGAVGAFVIQLARRRGAYVTATASAGNAEFVRGLGADQVIDYRAVPFEEEVREVDVVFDGVGGETLRRSWGVLKGSGRLVTIAAESEATPDERSRQAFFIVRPDRRQLLEVGGMLDRGELRAVVDTVLPFSRAGAAYSGKVERSGRGKVVVALFDEETQA